ncbi:MAG: cysteine-rich small domain-containing protein [Oscillospiraceae bacterium]|nr:cysteine-rich small domain-containing protein [Oscillospiraceae bacterium]
MDNAVTQCRFFCHKQCEYFPCHATDKPEDFNCMFCFCPLYGLGEGCGGNYSYTPEGIKNCTECIYPHKRENYASILERLMRP